MPIPKPKDDESQDEYMDRCLSNDTMNEEYPDNKQRYAICIQTWRDKDKEEDSFEPANFERRFYPVKELRIVRAENSTPSIEGYAALFNSLSQDLGGFREKIQPGAFKRALKKSDTRALFNHDSNYVLGRKSAKTLTLREDENGLKVKISPPDTQWARDLAVSVERGDIDQMSFGFIVAKDEWQQEGKNNIRTLLDIAELPDVSIVTFPAYTDTTVALRSRQAWELSLEPSGATADEEPPEQDSATAMPDPAARQRNIILRDRTQLIQRGNRNA